MSEYLHKIQDSRFKIQDSRRFIDLCTGIHSCPTNCLLIRHQIHITIYLVNKCANKFCAGSLQPAAQLGSKLSNSLSLFLLVSTSNDLTYFAYLARKFSLFAFTAGWSQAKMMCWTSCVTLQWGHRSV